MYHLYHKRRAANTQPAWRKNRPWEPWEDDLVYTPTKTVWEIADMLERTPAAVSNRRCILKARQNAATNNQKEDQK